MKPREVARAIDAKVPGPKPTGTKEMHRWATVDGRRVARVTYPKVHAGDVKPGTLDSIRKQLHLDREQFRRFIECPMSATEYEAIVRRLA